MFYSTIYKDGQKTEHLAQGKSILVSHHQAQESRRSTGYWGNAEYMPIDDMTELPEWLRRTEVGTTVASVGFAEEQNWQWLITESLIRNFFSAIDEGAIRFTVHWSEGFLRPNPYRMP